MAQGNLFKCLNLNIVNQSKPFAEIKFIHKDGKQHSFYTAVNDLTGNRISGFDGAAPSIDDSMSWIMTVFRDIYKKAKVIEISGDKKFVEKINKLFA